MGRFVKEDYPTFPSKAVSLKGSKSNQTFDDLLHRCWPHQECFDCLKQGPCSWCPVSSTCIPNTSKIHILAPIFDPDICPLWSERWELRARPLGCHVSTITLLTCVISVLSTFVFIGLVAIAIKVIRVLRSRWKTRSEDWWRFWRYYDPGVWKGWRLRLIDKARQDSAEQEPLLGDA